MDYEKTLKSKKQIDFHDMINESTKIVKKTGIYQYKYIIIDEYQDTSLNKVELIKEIQNKTNAKLMAVGDDWQSIYGFTGSNLDIFIDFLKIFPNSKIIKLKQTYRNPKELLKITRKFICKNPSQIYKRLKTKKTNKYPIHIYYYDKSIKEVWDKIAIETSNKDTLILSRNNKDINQIPYLVKNMHFLTIHKSKGLESENTVIINLENNYNSLPSKIKDSEYLKYVKPKTDNFKYAEERRLFYVALTRCKNINYLLVKKDNPSIFIEELIKNYSKYIKIHKKYWQKNYKSIYYTSIPNWYTSISKRVVCMSKKEKVIESARDLFCKYGYKKVSMDEIAKKSGVTKKTIYSYFKDKNELVKFFAYEEIEKMKSIVEKTEKRKLPAIEKTHNIIYNLLEYRKEEELLNKFTEEANYLPQGIADECLEMLNKNIMSEIKKLLEKGIENGEVKSCDTELASFLIYKLYVALMFEWDKPLDKKEVTENIMSFLKSGVFN